MHIKKENNLTAFEKEFQREGPISAYYLWYEGHKYACDKLLALGSDYAEKVFAVYQGGIFEVYTQKNNIANIKSAVSNLSTEILIGILERYETQYTELTQDGDLLVDSSFMAEFLGGFVITYTLGDIKDNKLQPRALELRIATQDIFTRIVMLIKERANNHKLYHLFTYEEVAQSDDVNNVVLLKRRLSILASGAVVPTDNLVEALQRYCLKENIVIDAEEHMLELNDENKDGYPSRCWIHVVGRNYYPLQAYGIMAEKLDSLVLKKLHFHMTDEMIVKNGTPLVHTFHSKKNSVSTNLLALSPDSAEDGLSKALSLIEIGMRVAPQDNTPGAIDLYQRFKKSSLLMIAGFYWSNMLDSAIASSLGSGKWDGMRQYLAKPYSKTTLIKEAEALNSAIMQYHNTQDQGFLEKVAANLATRYGYLHSEYCSQEWTKKHYEREIQEGRTRTEWQEKAVGPDIDQDSMVLLKHLRKTLYIYDEGKAAVVRAAWAMRKTLQNLGLDEKEMLYCFEDEFLSRLKGGDLPAREVLVGRRQYYGLCLKDGKMVEYRGKGEVARLLVEQGITYFEAMEYKSKLVQGWTASRGVAQGRVRIVLTQKDAEDFQQDEILVSSMTTPELMGAMLKAAAFVTDEGGVTSHAAIVARELKKPCIIGTKIATKVLKDNDLVEVDADNGIVKILN